MKSKQTKLFISRAREIRQERDVKIALPLLKLFCSRENKIPPSMNECLFRLIPYTSAYSVFSYSPTYLPAPFSPPGLLPCWCGEGHILINKVGLVVTLAPGMRQKIYLPSRTWGIGGAYNIYIAQLKY